MGTSRLMLSVLLLGLLACERGDDRSAGMSKAERDSLDYAGECGPCACDDEECYDSLQRANNPRPDSVTTLDRRDRPQALMAAPAAPNVTSFAAAAQAYSADTSLYRVKYALNKAVRTGDTVYLRLRRDSAQGITPLNILRKSIRQRDSADYKVDKIFGKAATYRAILQYRRAGSVIASRTVTWQTNFAAPVDTTPPVIDTLIVDSTLAIMKLDVKPDSVKIYAKNDSASKYPYTQQFCPLVVFADGKVTLPSEYMLLPACMTEYDKIPLAVKNVTNKQQARADSVCIKWEATGGTITASQCGGVPS